MTGAFRKLASFVTSLVLGASVLTAANAQERHVWRIQTIVPAGSQNFQNYEGLAADIKAATGGRVELRLLPAGAVVSATQTLEAVRQGVIDGHINYPFVFSGVEPGFAPMGDLSGAYFDAETVFGFFHHDVGLTLLREMYAKYNLHVIGLDTGGAESLPSRRPIKGIEDLKGLRIRVPAGISARILQELGATPVNLPFSEVFEALDKGVVDAVDAGALSLNWQSGLHKNARHAVFPGFHSVSIGDFSVNAAAWKKLSPDLQRIVEIATQNAVARYNQKLRIADKEAAKAAAADGVTITAFSPEDLARYRAAARKVWAEWAQRSPMAKRAIDAHVNYLKRIGELSD